MVHSRLTPLYQFGAGVMQFLLTLARGTYALPLSAVRKARRYVRDDDWDHSKASLAALNGSDSGAANAGSGLSKTPFAQRRQFAKLTCNMQGHYWDREVSPCRREAPLKDDVKDGALWALGLAGWSFFKRSPPTGRAWIRRRKWPRRRGRAAAATCQRTRRSRCTRLL